MINSIYVDNIIKTALLEDINYLDTATDYLIDDDQVNTARFLAKDSGVLCGSKRATLSPKSRAKHALFSRASAPRST